MWWDAAVRHSLGVGGLPIAFDLVEKLLFAAIKIYENLMGQRLISRKVRKVRNSKPRPKALSLCYDTAGSDQANHPIISKIYPESSLFEPYSAIFRVENSPVSN